MEWGLRKGTPTEPYGGVKSSSSIIRMNNHPPVLVLSLNVYRWQGLPVRQSRERAYGFHQVRIAEVLNLPPGKEQELFLRVEVS